MTSPDASEKSLPDPCGSEKSLAGPDPSEKLPTGPDVSEELLAVVNARDEEIGAAARGAVHARRLLHRAVHVLVFSADGRLLVQKRSVRKDTFPLHWECVGGHLGPGENYRDAAVRETGEELGIGVPRSELELLGKAAACETTGWEFIEIYRAITAETPHPNADEVEAAEWLTLEELRLEVAAGARLFSPVFLHTLGIAGLAGPQARKT